MKRQGILARLSVYLVVTTVGILPAVAQTTESADASRNQADAFLSRAASFSAAGNASSASLLLSSALQYAPDYSEALYFKATRELSDRSMTVQGLADLRLAIENGSWRTTDPDDARFALATVLLRTGKAAEALPFARQQAALHPETARTALLLVRCLAATGDAAAARKLAADSLSRFPNDDELRILSATLQYAQGQRNGARDTIATGLKIHPASAPLLLNAARWETDAKKQLADVDAYLAASGTDPLAALLGMEARGADRKKYLDAFLKLGGLSRQDLVDRAIAAVKSDKTLTGTLQDSRAAFSGFRDLDANGDGIWEDRWTFDKGSLTAWSREPSRDGVSLYSARFSAGQPVSFSYRTADGTVVALKYSRYPYVESAVPAAGDTYLVVPYTLQCAFLTSVSSAGIGTLVPQVLTRMTLPTLNQISAASYRQMTYAPDGTTVQRRIDLQAGKSVFLEEDTNGDGRIDHRVWFMDGLPVRGERSLGASTVFAVKETWNAGGITGVDIDTNGDGIADYHESYGPGTIRTWDFDQDGKADSREYRTGSGELVRELSTSLNGVFDLRVVTAGGKITAVSRNSVPVAVTFDPARNVTWIGTPAGADVRLETSLSEGLHTFGSTQYLVFKDSGNMYVEALQ